MVATFLQPSRPPPSTGAHPVSYIMDKAAGAWRWPPTPSSDKDEESRTIHLITQWAFVTCSRVSFTQQYCREWNTIMHDSPVVMNLLCVACSKSDRYTRRIFERRHDTVDSDNFRMSRLFCCSYIILYGSRGWGEGGLDFFSFLNIPRPRTRITNWKFIIPSHSATAVCKVLHAYGWRSVVKPVKNTNTSRCM
jgi:hypothetical protein